MEYTEQKGRFGALSARNLVKILVKFCDEITLRRTHEGL
jgi:hypothetical protein